MKLFTFALVLATAIASSLGQLIELGYPTNGVVLTAGQDFTVQVVQPVRPLPTRSTDYRVLMNLQGSIASVIQIGIALAVDNCNNGVCPQPTDQLGEVLYAGQWTPTGHAQEGFYQNFTVQISEYMTKGPAIFTLTHFCLLGVRGSF